MALGHFLVLEINLRIDAQAPHDARDGIPIHLNKLPLALRRRFAWFRYYCFCHNYSFLLFRCGRFAVMLMVLMMFAIALAITVEFRLVSRRQLRSGVAPFRLLVDREICDRPQ